MKYILSIASYHGQETSIVEELIRINPIKDLLFPARVAVSPSEYVTFHQVSDYSFSAIPDEFHPENGFMVPFESNDGVKFRVTGFFTPQFIPSSVVFHFSLEHIVRGEIDVDIMAKIISDIIPIQRSDSAFMYDVDSGRRREAQNYIIGPMDRKYALRFEWMTYYSDKVVEFLGRHRFEEISALTQVRKLNDGLLVILQDEPFNQTIKSHRLHRDKVEQVFGVEDFN